MSKSKVLFLMTGSIACYKACHAISRLVQANCEVQVVASTAALQFVGNATIEGLTGKSVVSDMYAPGNVMDHIHLMRWADIIVVAPASANFINKAAHGYADDLLHTLFLAHDFKKPFLIAPAMNTAMYNHPLTQESLQKLKQIGIDVLDSTPGSLACGEIGQGRLLEPDDLVKIVLERLQKSPSTETQSKASQARAAKILITSGGTQEPIDTVRVISNISSGRTGKDIAEKLNDLGFEVTLLRSHSSVSSALIPNQKVFTSFESLKNLLEEEIKSGHYTHIIHLAAVSDYSVDSIEASGISAKPFEIAKLSSDAESMSIHLKRNPKLVHMLKSWAPGIKVIAFKLTSQASAEARQNAVNKLFRKDTVDAVVHNDLSEIDIYKKIHKFTLHTKNGTQPVQGHEALAIELAKLISQGDEL